MIIQTFPRAIPNLHFKCEQLLRVYNKIAGLQHDKCIKGSLSCLIFNSALHGGKVHYEL